MSTELSLYGQIENLTALLDTQDLVSDEQRVEIEREIVRVALQVRKEGGLGFRRSPAASWRIGGGALMEPLGRNGKMRALLAAKSRPRWWERLLDWWYGVDRQTSATMEGYR